MRGSSFTCLTVTIGGLDKAGSPGRIESILLEAAGVLRETLRSTDDFAYVKDGLFFIVAPERLPNRAETLIRRTVRRMNVRLWRLADDGDCFPIRSGSFAFDGRNGSPPAGVMKEALASLG